MRNMPTDDSQPRYVGDNRNFFAGILQTKPPNTCSEVGCECECESDSDGGDGDGDGDGGRGKGRYVHVQYRNMDREAALVVYRRDRLQFDLYHAIRLGSLKKVAKLLKRGADPAVACWDIPMLPPVCAAALRGHTKIVQLLLEQNATVNLPNPDITPESPLYMAVKNGCIDTCRFLIEHNADLDAQSSNPDRHCLGQSIVGVAVREEWPDIVKLLLDSGANPCTFLTITGCSPLLQAANL